MWVIYNTKHQVIDKHISDCQMGARKGKGCRNNVWIINGIIHKSIKSKNMKPILLQIYDYKQMFDSINLEEAIIDIYDYGLKDDNLALIYKANEKINMAVKTPGRLTE
jgi:Ca2+-dependent lipid-binding protein